MRTIKIGIYEENGTLIGYKIDSFWSLDKECYKPHSLNDNGKIPEHLIDNLKSILGSHGYNWFESIQRTNKQLFHSNFETRLLGYEVDGTVTYTHRIFEKDIQELSQEDLAKIEGKL